MSDLISRKAVLDIIQKEIDFGTEYDADYALISLKDVIAEMQTADVEMGVAKNAITNADYIRNMTDEELAKAISRNNTCVRCNIREYCHENIKCRNCVDAVLDWLKAEREG